MLLLAHAACKGAVFAATVDHGLRSESADEARFCAQICSDLDVPHRILAVDVNAGNVQANARHARYRALGEWLNEMGAHALLTAHHADDQAETMLMRLNRGSGLSGLSGIRRSTQIPGHDAPLLRPLLDWRKADLEQIVATAGITPVFDPSNQDDRFDRARIRKFLAEADWLDPQKIAQSAAHLQEAEEAIARIAETVWRTHVEVDGASVIIRPDLEWPKLVEMRILSRAIAQLGGKEAAAAMVATLLDDLKGGRGGNIAGVLAKSKGGNWLLEREPERRPT